jgi:alanine racemase
MDTLMATSRCWVEIRPQALEKNYRALSAIGGAELLAVVKADAYGHSLALCAPAAVRAGARWLGVTCVEEGLAARALCPDVRVLIISGCVAGEGATAIEHGLTAVLWEQSHLDELEAPARAAGKAARSVAVHLEIDTGMSRQGAALDQLPALIARFANHDSPLRVEGVMTHLYAADESDGQADDAQLARLAEALQVIQAGLDYQPEWLNVGASAALLSRSNAEIGGLAQQFGMKAMIRPGLSLYGILPEFEPAFEGDAEPQGLVQARAQLVPVLTWKTRVVSLRTVPSGSVVGYNGTFVASEPMRLALLSVGYADGLDRRLGNRFSLLVRGQRTPLVGRVSMDLAVIDVTGINGVEAGDEVVILGTQGSETITASDHAHATGTIPWEIFTRIAQRVHRVAI